MKLHDPDEFELKQALKLFTRGDSTLSEICENLGIRPGPIYDAYVEEIKAARDIPPDHLVRIEIKHHTGFDRIYNDIPQLVKIITERFPDCFLYELADYEPLPDTEWVTFFVPEIGFVKLYTSLFIKLECYVEVVHLDIQKSGLARELATEISEKLDDYYRSRVERINSLSYT